MNHSPGPWQWVNSDTDEVVDMSQDDGVSPLSLRTVKYYDWDGRLELPKFIISYAELGDDACFAQNGHGNALLLQHAPDLFEACMLFMSTGGDAQLKKEAYKVGAEVLQKVLGY